MAGGYQHKPDGTDGLAAIVKGQQRQIDALRSGAGIKSAILRNAQLQFQDEAGNTSGIFGHRIANRLGADGSSSAEPADGATFFDPEGGILFTAQKYETTGDSLVQAGTAGANTDLTLFRVFSADVAINGDDVDINSNGTISLHADGGMDLVTGGRLGLFELPTTGSAANLHLGTVGGNWTVAWVTSSLKYKQDVEDADVDPAEVLALTGRTWRDKNEVEHDPDSEKRFVGFIAEELDEHPTLRQFVDYKDGEPDAIQYDRLSVALLAVIKDQQARLDDHEERLNRLENGGQ